MTCATGKMMCATRQNDVRSWQNDVRAISDGTDVLGKMVCALMCALVCALLCAPMAGVPVAQRISFSSDQPKVYEVLQPFLWKRGQQLALRFHVPFAMARDRGAKCFYLTTVVRCAVPRRPQMAKWTMAR